MSSTDDERASTYDSGNEVREKWDAIIRERESKRHCAGRANDEPDDEPLPFYCGATLHGRGELNMFRRDTSKNTYLLSPQEKQDRGYNARYD